VWATSQLQHGVSLSYIPFIQIVVVLAENETVHNLIMLIIMVRMVEGVVVLILVPVIRGQTLANRQKENKATEDTHGLVARVARKKVFEWRGVRGVKRSKFRPLLDLRELRRESQN
jgi:hypothetical protein